MGVITKWRDGLARLLPLAAILLLAGCTLADQREVSPTPVNPTLIAPEEAAEFILDQGVGTTAHDPTIIKDEESGRYYLFATGPGIPVHESSDLKEWRYIDRALPTNPEWIRTTVPKATDLWAPDVAFYQGKYYLFYSASSFGENLSAIGLASNVTLDPKSPDFGWVDEGVLITSTATNNFNAIDPAFALDAEGEPWLLYGSFWSGIKLRKLNPDTLMPANDETPLYSVAARTRSPGAIEGAFLLRAYDYYYLFVSHDFCCRGVDSTYKIKVGRSQNIMGPYLDRDGKDMMQDGGTLILESSPRWIGPGHNSILVDDGRTYLVYHAYDAENGGVPRLRVEELLWDEEGWPIAPSALLEP